MTRHCRLSTRRSRSIPPISPRSFTGESPGCRQETTRKLVLDFDRVLEISPQNAEALLEKGQSPIPSPGSITKPCLSLEGSLEQNPAIGEAWYYRGLSFFRLDRFEDSLAAFDRAILLDPKLTDARVRKGVALSKLLRFSEAAAVLDRSLEEDPRNLPAWCYKGISLSGIEQYRRGDPIV